MDSSFSLTTFSSTGKLVQIEHALNAVNQQGRPALGVRAANGVVLASEKKLRSTIVESESLHKVEFICPEIGCVYAGMPADYRVIVQRARKDAAEYRLMYGCAISATEITRRVANVMQEYTQSGGVRPFGCSLLIAGYDANDGSDPSVTGKIPRLYQVDPSGAYFAWKATATGKDSVNAKAFLEKRYRTTMEVEDAVNTALLTLREGFEGVLNETNVEIGILGGPQQVFKILSPAEVKDYLQELE